MVEKNIQRVRVLEKSKLNPVLTCSPYGDSFCFSSRLVDHYNGLEASISGRGVTADEAVNDYFNCLSKAHNIAVYEDREYKYFLLMPGASI